MASSSTPPWLIVQIAREQGGVPLSKTICPYCGNPGATDPHHWCYKRSDHVPDEVLHTPENIVMACKGCHDAAGQTKDMTEVCLRHKMNLGYDIFGWVDQLLEKGLVLHRPDIYGLI